MEDAEKGALITVLFLVILCFAAIFIASYVYQLRMGARVEECLRVFDYTREQCEFIVTNRGR
jgi:hypothetical protein